MARNDKLIRIELEAVIGEAYRLSEDVGKLVEDILRTGRERPLAHDEAFRLLTRVVAALKAGAEGRGDRKSADALGDDTEQLVKRVMQARDRLSQVDGQTDNLTAVLPPRVQLVEMQNVIPSEVQPRPVFHGREIPMEQGFVRTTDIPLWEDNRRLGIHIAQFREKVGRAPSADELLDIMLSRVGLPGVPEREKGDQFGIEGLARSIATNGVRKPPILDTDGTLLDGNRRVAACHFILHSDEFSIEQKRRAEHIFVWKLTQYATDEDREAVIVSLNFEPDHKIDWPDYIKARQVFDDWQEILTFEPQIPSKQRLAELKRQLSMKYALGPDTATVNRYIKMVEWVELFEDYHVNIRGRNQHEVEHRANKYFQFFDELSRGARSGGVAWVLEQDQAFRHLVFDLLLDGKFTEWHQIKPLKSAYENEDARAALIRARDTADIDDARERVDNALAIARMESAVRREIGVNTRVESFVEWLEQIPLRAFTDGAIDPDKLSRLVRSLEKLVKLIEAIKRVTEPSAGKARNKPH
jgi:hypothetical protein